MNSNRYANLLFHVLSLVIVNSVIFIVFFFYLNRKFDSEICCNALLHVSNISCVPFGTLAYATGGLRQLVVGVFLVVMPLSRKCSYQHVAVEKAHFKLLQGVSVLLALLKIS